jgi:hypothetical protein
MIPTITAIINPTIPMIISAPEPVVYLPIVFSSIILLFKDHSKIVWNIDESSFVLLFSDNFFLLLV